MKRMWPAVFILAGLAVLAYGIGLMRDARNCAGWPTVEGTITASDIQVVSREKDRRIYAPNVAYTYVVGSRRFEGTRLTLVPRNYAGEQQTRSILARYPTGGTVRVFHHPNDPANAVLDTGSIGNEWALPLAEWRCWPSASTSLSRKPATDRAVPSPAFQLVFNSQIRSAANARRLPSARLAIGIMPAISSKA